MIKYAQNNRLVSTAMVLKLVLGIGIFTWPAQAQKVSADFSGESLQAGPSGGACDGTIEGALQYNSGVKALQFCDGTAWRTIWNENNDVSTPAFTAGNGAFVLTSVKYDGNLGGISGANSLCLTDLTNNSWHGKASLTVDSTSVKAFLCYGSWNNCQLTQANTTYSFAVSGNASLGGATFTTDASGYGPGNDEVWNDTLHFGTGSKQYWSGYRASSGQTLWTKSNGAGAGAGYICNGGSGPWTSNSAADTGTYGRTGDAGLTEYGNDRWHYSEDNCDDPKYLICMVNP